MNRIQTQHLVAFRCSALSLTNGTGTGQENAKGNRAAKDQTPIRRRQASI